MGGDEFTVLLTDVDGRPGAIRVAERVGAELSASFAVAGHQVVVQASIGIAHSVPGQTSAQELLRNADIAMYEAKEQGKGQYQMFTPGMDQAAWTWLELEAELRVSIQQQQVELYYQPILDLDSGAVSELEALVRWDHPSRGLLPPADFIPLAEATLQALRGLGVHVAVDDFGTGFSALGALKHYPVDSLKIDRSFVDGLGRDAQDTAIVHAVIAFAKTLGLRVTGEGIETAEQLEQLRALGCDHGQGYYFAKPLQHGSVQPFLAAHQRAPADQHTPLGDL